MRDPHVVFLTYRMKPISRSLMFDDSTAIEQETNEFSMKLVDSVVTFEMKTHFASVAAAQGAVSNFLKSWEVDSWLKEQEISFVYNDSKLIDRNPPLPGESQVIYPESLGELSPFGTPSVHLISKTYPKPPSDFKVTPDVETLWNRYNGFVDGRERVSSMGYFCLTVLEFLADPQKPKPRKGSPLKRKKAAQKFKISLAVLDHLGELTSKGRKYDQTGEPSASEAEFIKATVKVLIKRLGEDLNLAPEITLKDLPKL